MRTYRQIIRDAELLSMAPEDVCDALKARSLLTEMELRDDLIDTAMEEALFARQDPLVNLALAQYGRSVVHLSKIFAFAPRESALSLACLANKVHKLELLNRFPVDLFGTEPQMQEWLAQASQQEIAAIFENPALGNEFLIDFLEQAKGWDTLPNEKLCLALLTLTRNPRIGTSRDDDWMDGYADYTYSAVFNAGWGLAERLKPTVANAVALGHFFDKLLPEAFRVKDPLSLAGKWHPDPGDEAALKQEAQSSGYGSLGYFQLVRAGLAKLAVKQDRKVIAALLASDDQAFRATAYELAPMKPDEVHAAFERDGQIAFYAMLQNLRIWESNDQRQALKDCAWKIVNADKHSDLLAANLFNRKDEWMREQHADYFKDEEYEDDEPVRESSPELQELERQGLILRGMSKAQEALTSKVNWAVGLAAGALVMTLVKH